MAGIEVTCGQEGITQWDILGELIEYVLSLQSRDIGPWRLRGADSALSKWINYAYSIYRIP